MIVHSSRIYCSDGMKAGYLEIECGKFKRFIDESVNVVADLDVGDHRIIPGIVDTHNHGCMGYNTKGDTGNASEIIDGYLRGLASNGVTAIMPTFPVDWFEVTADKANEKETVGARIIGIHSEGPYQNRVGEKGIDLGHPDIDVDYCRQMVEKGKGWLKLVGVAPELPKAREAIEYFTHHGCRCAFMHTNADYHLAKESFKWGISVITHTCNVMSGIHHRRMGGLGAALLDDDVYNEVICDGLHVSVEMLELMFRVKHRPFDKFIMISDNVPIAGAPVGHYKVDGWVEVNVNEEGYCLSDTGRLMGSTKPVIWGIKLLNEKLHIDLEDIIKMSSLNPALVHGVGNHKGSIECGKDADFVVIDDDFKVLYTYVEGDQKYDYHHPMAFNEEFVRKYRTGEVREIKE